ncbi:replication-relaxation family protein [Agromyces bauzanensis]
MSGLWRIEEHLSDRDIRILEDLETYRLLTTRQLQRLHLPTAPYGDHVSVSAATRGTTRILGRLEQLDVVRRLQRRIGGVKHGSANTIWQLGPTGERYLRMRRGLPKRRRYEEPGLTFISHTLAVRDLVADVHEHASTDHYEVLDLRVEPDCWRPFTAAGGETVMLKPDLFVVTADTATETHAFVEVDLDTEHLPAVIRKCRTYQRYYATGIEQADRGVFPAVIWIVPSLERRDRLRQRIAADKHLDAALFWVITTEQALRHLAPYEASTTT